MQNIHDLAMFRFNFWPKPFLSPPAAHQPFPQGMENSSFITNPLGSPALMVLASTAESHEGARIPGPPRYTGQEKDGATFTTMSMYRPEHFPPPLYAPVSHFVRPGMDRGVRLVNPGGGSAFRPVSTENAEGYHSAFSPAKRCKAEDLVIKGSSYNGNFTDSNQGDESNEDSGCKDGELREERPSSQSSVTYDTNSETHSEGGDFDRGTPDSEGRSLRKQRKKIILDGQTPCCPICGLTLRPGEVEPHLQQELEKLERIARGGRKSRDTTPQGRKTLPSPCAGRRGKDGSPSLDAVSQARHENYLRIQCNRQARLSARSRNRKKKASEETTCPICSLKVTGTAEELNEHVELCLKKRDEGDDELLDVEGDTEQYEEYTWAGQTRIRVASMLEGGFAASGFQTASTSRKGVDEDVDLNVDGDDSEQYGTSQYGEADIIPCSTDEPMEDKERQALRGAVLSTSDSPHPVHSPSTSEIESAHYIATKGSTRLTSTLDNMEEGDSPDYVGGSAGQIITALKVKLKSKDSSPGKMKCLICMEPYVKPLTSIQCWHVHCEGCWLQTLGAKKLCPQCNMITSPADLRRIYM